MARIKLDGTPCNTVGELPAVGSEAPDVALVTTDLTEKRISDFRGKKVLLYIFPSVYTGVCATSTRRFNELAAGRDDVEVVYVSADLPFAAGRFCTSEHLDNVTALSTFRGSAFGAAYGVRVADGPFEGLMSRAVVVIDENGKVTYTEQVPDIGEEPDYEAALAQL